MILSLPHFEWFAWSKVKNAGQQNSSSSDAKKRMEGLTYQHVGTCAGDILYYKIEEEDTEEFD